MSMRNLVNYRKQPYMEKGLFVYLGTEALFKGHGMCFNLDYTTVDAGEAATDKFGARGLRVIEKPNGSNKMAFAGVLTQDYPARSTGMQMVELALPGGCAEIAVGISTILKATQLTCVTQGQPGLFIEAGITGRGTALALQTRPAGPGGIIGSSIDGTAAYATATRTVSKTGLFANAVTGDKIVVVGGQNAETGDYTIVSRTDNTAVVDRQISATNGAIIAIYVISGNPTVLAYLYDGKESGLVDFVMPVSGAAVTPAPQTGGVTRIIGTVSLAAASTIALAGGAFQGMEKEFRLTAGTANAGTAGLAITIAGGGLGFAAGTNINTLSVAKNIAGHSRLEWNGVKWQCRGLGGFTEA